jgi:amidase
VHPSCRVALERTLDALEKRGHRVVDDAPAALATYVDRTLYGAVLGPLGFRECLDELAERLGRPVDARDVEPFLWELSTHPETVLEGSSQADIERALAWTQEWERSLLGWFDGNDVLVTPTVHMPAPDLDSFDPTRHTPLELLEKMVPHMAFTEPFNATGQPAISLPLGQSPDGLPVGVQLVGRIGREDDLLSLAADLLEDLGPGDARPRIHA